jgi:hypothetical protein
VVAVEQGTGTGEALADLAEALAALPAEVPPTAILGRMRTERRASCSIGR